MVLNDFSKTALIGIASGVKEANVEIKENEDKASFALKNSAFFEDKRRSSIEFELLLEEKESTVHVIEQHKMPENVNRIKFNVVQVQSIS